MIRFEGVTKEYNDIKALDNLNLEIKEGEIFGLIGHNGAGKSTAIKSLVSVINPEYGKIYVNDLLLDDHRQEIKKKIAYVSDSPDKFLKMEVSLFWSFMAKIYRVDNGLAEQRIKELCKLFNMEEASYKSIEELSHGMRQKAFVIGALISNPEMWILDEPLTGLDPQSAYNLKNMMRHHAEQGNCVLFSTHVLETAEQICDRIGILKKGKLIFSGSLDELREKYPGKNLEEIYLDMVNISEEMISDNEEVGVE